MGRHDWERELRERQRNIVFPDTVLNQGTFYRAVFRSKTSLPRTHRLGLLLLAAPFLFGGCFGLAASIAGFLHSTGEIDKLLSFTGGIAAAASCAFGIALVVRALVGTPARMRPRRRPRGHIPTGNS